MYKHFYIFIFIMMLLSCSSSSDVLPKEKMEKVMWDMAQSSEFLNGFVYYKYPEQNRAALNDAMMQKVFDIHHITKEQFIKTMDYYKRNPQELKVVMDSVVSKKRRELDKSNNNSSPLSDSNRIVPAL